MRTSVPGTGAAERSEHPWLEERGLFRDAACHRRATRHGGCDEGDVHTVRRQQVGAGEKVLATHVTDKTAQ